MVTLLIFWFGKSLEVRILFLFLCSCRLLELAGVLQTTKLQGYLHLVLQSVMAKIHFA
jgi:hypothetical protein